MGYQTEYGFVVRAEVVEDFWQLVKANKTAMEFVKEANIIRNERGDVLVHDDVKNFSDLDAQLGYIFEVLEDQHDDAYNYVFMGEEDPVETGGSYTDHDFGLYVRRELFIREEVTHERIGIPNGVGAMREAVKDEDE